MMKPKTLYEFLEVARDATRETIRFAFRKLSKRYHPDMGGSKEQWQMLLLAHDVLTDPERKDQYDRTGEYSDSPPRDQTEVIALGMISQLIFNLISSGHDLTTSDLKKIAIEHLEKNIKLHEDQLKAIEQARLRAETLVGRWKTGEEVNFLESIVKSQFDNFERSTTNILTQIKAYSRAIEILNLYSFQYDKQNFVVNQQYQHEFRKSPLFS